MRNITSEAYRQSQEPVYEALTRLNDLADGVAALAPIGAQSIATADIDQHWKPPVELAIVVSARGGVPGDESGLPVDDDGFDVLCGRAGGIVGAIAALPVSLRP